MEKQKAGQPANVETIDKDAQSGTTGAAIPIVAVGASAVGRSALELFFRYAPDDKGWCYIVVQHLSADRRARLEERIRRHTKLKIKYIEDGARIESDTIFLNRPDTHSQLEGSVFRTRPYDKNNHRPNLPIDALFSSLAARDGERTIGIILSGSGRDGANGAQYLHAAGGSIIVQSPAQADFPSMPRSVLSTGSADLAVDIEEMPEAIETIFATGQRISLEHGEDATSITRDILRVLEKYFRLDFTPYKEINVLRRLTRRQQLRGLDTTKEYLDLLRTDREAANELYRDLLIGVTEFYRDAEAMAALRKDVIDLLVDNQDHSDPLRIWVAGCASGEEAYTLAIEISEAMQEAGDLRSFRIIATDAHRASIEFASHGSYSQTAVGNIPEHLLNKYFEKKGKTYTVSSALRQKIIFSEHDALSDPPFLDLDLISCRNLLIYFREEAQSRVVSMFLFGLKKNGALFLGPSENLGRYETEFEVVNSRWRIFRKKSSRRIYDRALVSDHTLLPKSTESSEEYRKRNATEKSEKPRPRVKDTLVRSYDMLLKSYAPSAILITSEGDVLSWFGLAGAFIDTRNNMADWTVEEIVNPDLQFDVNVALAKLRSGDFERYSRDVSVELNQEKLQNCTLTFEPLDVVNNPRLMLIKIKLNGEEDEPDEYVISTKSGTKNDADEAVLKARVRELERDLKLTEDTLQHVTERLEASGEELQASNEALQAFNEELQASNEELQSANEELNAVNEELVSVSAEHKNKIEQLSVLNRETEHLLTSLGLGVMHVDRSLSLLRFSQAVADRFALEDHDVQRKLGVIGPKLDFVDLKQMAAKVVESGKPASASGIFEGKPISVEAQPLRGRTGQTKCEGVFLIFRDA